MQRKATNTHISLLTIKQYLSEGTYDVGITPIAKRAVRKRAESFKIVNDELFYIHRPKCVDGESPDPDPGSNSNNLRKVLMTSKDQLLNISKMHVASTGRSLLTGNHFCYREVSICCCDSFRLFL